VSERLVSALLSDLYSLLFLLLSLVVEPLSVSMIDELGDLIWLDRVNDVEEIFPGRKVLLCDIGRESYLS
jgi:hypothetical protein